MKYNGAIKIHKDKDGGFSLFEVLIAISVFAVIGAIAAQLIGISLQSEKTSAQKTVALQLAQEESEAVDSLAAEYWQNIYGLSKGPANKYYAVISGSKWATSTSEETVTINNDSYKRHFYVENVSRDSGGAITTSGGNDDPSTQKVTVAVKWFSGGLEINTATTTKYIMRARNTAASQTQWYNGGGTGPGTGETGTFGTNFTASSSIDFSVNPTTTLRLLP
ncbi:prepilin-type N-terminal cleavage/methylation domain-containing protein [Candidatus Azambacteria bacterium]|nr:prepilin-type N-terminal cleavage/methylation domain-containing protein [Candidatus Azambacteria bacterium]